MKKLIVLVMVILVVGLLAGCWVLPESALDRIEANPDDVTLNVGDTQQLEVIAYYDDETSADVTSNCDYSSSNTEVVTVNDEGLIVAVDSGEEVTILVSYTQQNFWTGRRIRTDEVVITVAE